MELPILRASCPGIYARTVTSWIAVIFSFMVLNFQTNVKEHAPSPAGASVDSSERPEPSPTSENRAAGDGCCGSACSPPHYLTLEVVEATGDWRGGRVLAAMGPMVDAILPTRGEARIVMAFINLFKELGEQLVKDHPSIPGCFLRVTWPNGDQNPSPEIREYYDRLLEQSLRDESGQESLSQEKPPR